MCKRAELEADVKTGFAKVAKQTPRETTHGNSKIRRIHSRRQVTNHCDAEEKVECRAFTVWASFGIEFSHENYN